MVLLRAICVILGALGSLGSAASDLRPRDFISTDYYVLHLTGDVQPSQIAARLGLHYEELLGELADHHIFSGVKVDDDIVQVALQMRQQKRSLGDSDILDGVLLSRKQQLREPLQKRVVPFRAIPPRVAAPNPAVPSATSKSQATTKLLDTIEQLNISDPGFSKQWHLLNTAQTGHDLNVVDVWLQGITGKNATVAIVDDGLDMDSNDLKANYYATGSHDFNDDKDDPRPLLSDDTHGTRCAGEVAAGKNNFCGVGVAYDAKIAGIRILSQPISDSDEAAALNFDYQHNQIYSCSWGPPDDGESMSAPGLLVRRAILNGIQKGRGSLGSIFVFATGNGAQYDDDCNFDGYANSIYSITIGAVDRYDKRPYYSERCAAQMAVAYSSGSSDAIYTTDVGVNTCTSRHSGTSASAPLAAGVFALALDIRPDLSWRDMQYLTLETAVPIDTNSTSLQTTAIGKKFSHTSGYGKIDAFKLITKAKTWKNVKPQSWFFSPWVQVRQTIPQGEGGIVSTFELTADTLRDANLESIEHVTIIVNAGHGRRGDLSIDLISPEKVVSHIATTREEDTSKSGYYYWEFMSVAHWGENGVGTWTVVMRDTVQNEYTGTFVDWRLKLWGVSIEASKATTLPMPTSNDDQDDVITQAGTKSAATLNLPRALFSFKLLGSRVKVISSIILPCALWIYSV